MEALLAEQEELIIIINKCFVHFKELPPSFISKGQIQTRINNLDEYWLKFKTNHFELVRMAADTGIKIENVPYFKHEMFYFLNNTYNSAKGSMVDELENLNSQHVRVDWQEYAICNEEIFSFIKKAGANVKKLPESLQTKGYYKARTGTIDELWKKFRSTHFEIVKLATVAEKQLHSYFTNEIFMKCDEEYVTTRGRLTDILAKLDSFTEKANRDKATESEDKKLAVNLSQSIENNNDWNLFKDVCSTLLHGQPTLENIQNIIEQARHLLNSLKLGEKDDIAKETFYKTPINIFRQSEVNIILHRLINLKKIQHPTAKSIKKLLDVATDGLLLMSDTLDITNWDAIMIYILSNKLDEETLSKWVKELEKLPSDELPKLGKFTDFLETLHKSLESQGNNEYDSDGPQTNYSQYKPVAKNGNTAPNLKPDPFCCHCLKWGHYDYMCQYEE